MRVHNFPRGLTVWVLAGLLAACSGGSASIQDQATASSSGGGASGTPTVVSTHSPPPATNGFVALTLSARPQQFSADRNCPPFLEYGSPSLAVDFLCRTGFAVGHDPTTRTPAWVIERLGLASLNGGVERTDNFRADPDLSPGRRAELEDYVGSGFDRGHMAAAGNLTWSNQAMAESFYLSNIAPQNPTLNRGAWARLEADIRNWVLERTDLVVITGPVFGTQDAVIGRSPVRVPLAFYKIVFDPFRREAVGFVYPNSPPTSSDPVDYRVPVEQIERTTGLAFISLRQ
jgi:endonuclease G